MTPNPTDQDVAALVARLRQRALAFLSGRTKPTPLQEHDSALDEEAASALSALAAERDRYKAERDDIQMVLEREDKLVALAKSGCINVQIGTDAELLRRAEASEARAIENAKEALAAQGQADDNYQRWVTSEARAAALKAERDKLQDAVNALDQERDGFAQLNAQLKADNAELTRENKRLGREWIASEARATALEAELHQFKAIMGKCAVLVAGVERDRDDARAQLARAREATPEAWELEAAAVFMDHVNDDDTGSVHRVAAFLRRCAETPRCGHCDGTGDVHRADGEWLGSCDCATAPADGRGDQMLAVATDLPPYISPIALDGSLSADWIAMVLSEDARIEDGRLANEPYLAVKIAKASDRILARAKAAEQNFCAVRTAYEKEIERAKTAEAQLARAREALGEIAKQRLRSEVTDSDPDELDWLGGYEGCVKRAREALRSIPAPADGRGDNDVGIRETRAPAPDGWQLVPVEPTEDMLMDGHDETPYCHASPEECRAILGARSCHQGIADVYRAMLAAAPPVGSLTSLADANTKDLPSEARADAQAVMADIAYIVGEWRHGPMLSGVAVHAIRSALTAPDSSASQTGDA